MLQKMMDRMFKKVAGVVYDMTANSIGITKGDSVFTVCQTEGGEYELVENLLASLSAPIPAIARSVPLAQVKELDMILSQDGEPFGWVVKVNPKSLSVIKPNGTRTNVVPAKVNLLGQGQTVMVVSSLGAGGQMDPMMIMAMMGDDGEMSDMLPFLMMQGGNMDMNAMMPLLMMSRMGKGEGEGGSDMMKMMMLQQMMAAQQGTTPVEPGAQANPFGAMNPMMLALMMGKL